MRKKNKVIFAVLALMGAISIFSFLYARLPGSAELRVSSNVSATAFIKGSQASTPASFTVKRGMVDVMVAARGYAASIQTCKADSGSSFDLNVPLAPSPVPQDIPGGSYCVFPSFCPEQGKLFFLGNRGASLISTPPGGVLQNMNDDKLAQVTGLRWSPDGRFALLRVEPAGEALATIGSPLLCSSPSTFIYSTTSNLFQKAAIPIAQGSSFTADSSLVAFGSMENGSSTITVAPLASFCPGGSFDNTKATTFNLGTNMLVPYCYISPDGSYIVYSRTPGDQVMSATDLFIIETKTGDTQRITQTGNIYGASWSPQGSCLLYEQRDPKSGLPTIIAYSPKTGETWSIPINTYIRKVAWYSDDIILAGKPYDIEKALESKTPTTPDALIYCSVSTGLYATLVPAGPAAPENYTDPVIGENGNALYFTHSLILRRVDLAGLRGTIDLFASSQANPIVLNQGGAI